MDLTCEHCGQQWSVNCGHLIATPGYRTADRPVVVPREDVYGRIHGVTRTLASVWVNEGLRRPVEHADDGASTRYTWTCQCDARMSLSLPSMTWVTCTWGSDRGMCHVARRRASPPDDLYINSANGSVCVCCGSSGAHIVRAGSDSRAPCLTESASSGVVC